MGPTCRLFAPMNETEQLVALISRLRRYARALVGEQAGADDLVQETLERACSRLHLFRPGGDLRAWVFTIMHNVHLNKMRAARPTDALGESTLVALDLDRAMGGLSTEQ